MRTVQGLVIGITDYKDHDKLLKILVKNEGLITLYGRGMNKINSKNNGNALPYMISDFVIEEHDVKKILQLRSCQKVKMYRKCREDIVKNIIASLMCEYACSIMQEDNYEIYGFMVKSLDLLEEKQDSLLIYSLFLSQVASILGIQPFVDGCLKCGKTTGITYLSIEDGGFICENCNRSGIRNSVEFLKLFRVITKAKYENLEQIKYQNNDLETVIDFYHEFLKKHGGMYVKGCDLLQDVLHL